MKDERRGIIKKKISNHLLFSFPERYVPNNGKKRTEKL